ncbi:MAG: GGDEF domain-containing protein [Clostridia bacterium]|nr:GGDEF domain-containing protein [Clostridia bacterium]
MRKRICVFIGEIAQDYQKIVTQNIVRRANRFGYDVVVIASYGSYNEDILYAEGEKACIYLPDCSTFDGIIIAEDVFDIDGMPYELYELLQKNAKCPIVYLRSTRDGCYSIQTENSESIASVVSHFVDYHGFTDICYMSGKKGAEDAQERLEGYISVMKEHGIEVTEHMIFHGDYWRYKGEEALEWFMEGRTTYPQAIVCANDYMALSICEALRVRGVKVPEDVCVSGFDFLDEAKVNTPSLTSLEVDFEGMVRSAVDIIVNVNNGKQEEKVHRIKAQLRLHKSCGCGGQYVFDNVIGLLASHQKMIDDTKNTFISVTEYQYAFGFDEYMKIADKHRRFMRSDKCYLCFADLDEKGFEQAENDNLYTDQMYLKRIFEGEKPAEFLDVKFPRKQLLPEEYWSEDKPNNFCIFGMHFKNIVYGYIVAEIPDEGWFDIHTQGYLMTLANAIENGEIHKKMEHLETIKNIYHNDALTGLLNRRGFDKKLQETYALAQAENRIIGIASIDMDNLKTINDTMGHAEGDRALSILGRALNSVMQEGDFCGRIGGDEFAAVIDVSYPGRCRDFKKALNDALKQECIGTVKYFVEASVGFCENTDPAANGSIVSCIQIADKRMYEEKRSRKARIK